MTFYLSTVCCWQKAVAEYFCDAIVFILMFSSAKGRKDQVWIWDSFENFFQITVVGQNLFLVGFRINSHDLLSSVHVNAAVITGKNDVHFSVECFCSVWCSEQQRTESQPPTQQVEKCVWTGEKRSDESRFYCKIHGKHESDLIFCCFAPHLLI